METAEIQEQAQCRIKAAERWLERAMMNPADDIEMRFIALTLATNHLLQAVTLFNENVNWNQIDKKVSNE